MKSSYVKVCGMRDADNIREVERLGIDLMGFIFWPRSCRYVSERPAYLPTACKRVGVFVDAAIDEVLQKTQEYALDIIQLHGHESPEYIRQLRGLRVIKAVSIGKRSDLAVCRDYEGAVDCFLFDTKGESAGGNGVRFDWTVLDAYDGQTPFLLSGGIGPDDAERVRAFQHPRCIGIDLNSRFEKAPALKDSQQLETFIKKIRHEQNQ